MSRLKDNLSKHLKRKQIVEKFKNIEQRLRMLEEDGEENEEECLIKD